MKEQQSDQIDNIDFFYVLRDHGWSSCLIYVDGKIYGYDLTHIFENPIEVLLSHLTGFMKGEDEVSFNWHDEPGHNACTFTRQKDQHHKMDVSITNSFQINTGTQPEGMTLTFPVKTKVFMTCVLKQMEKIRDLMTDRSFKDHRAQFPHISFNDFKSAFDNLYSKAP